MVAGTCHVHGGGLSETTADKRRPVGLQQALLSEHARCTDAYPPAIAARAWCVLLVVTEGAQEPLEATDVPPTTACNDGVSRLRPIAAPCAGTHIGPFPSPCTQLAAVP